ncbi:MAG TPA: COQ9 family protein [Caulobacteraceae bacterium]|nr:COQ9 family protein [Caulobacteraceae bacterium]
MTVLETDWTQDAEARLLTAAIPLAPEVGWTSRLVDRAARGAGLSQGEAMLVVPNGARDLAALFSQRHDRAALTALASVEAGALKVRERIFRAVEARLDAAALDGEATRRWAGYLALPQNAALAMRLVWASADELWRWAGDRSTDENHYSKRAILAGILVSTLAVRLNGGPDAARAHLAAQIDRVMAYERWKAKVRAPDLARDLAAALGRMRYGGGA